MYLATVSAGFTYVTLFTIFFPCRIIIMHAHIILCQTAIAMEQRSSFAKAFFLFHAPVLHRARVS